MLTRMVGAPLLAAILGMLGRDGGLGSLIERFRGAGLADKADSWVGPGPNTPLNADEVERALGPEEIRRAADETGLDEAAVREGLAAGIPEVIDHLTPKGSLPDPEALTGLVERLRGALPD